MRRVLVLLAVAGGLAAVFATAAQRPSTDLVSKRFSALIVVRSDCSIAGGALQLPGPAAFDCRTHREAERLGARFTRLDPYGSTVVSVRGTKVVFP